MTTRAALLRVADWRPVIDGLRDIARSHVDEQGYITELGDVVHRIANAIERACEVHAREAAYVDRAS